MKKYIAQIAICSLLLYGFYLLSKNIESPAPKEASPSQTETAATTTEEKTTSTTNNLATTTPKTTTKQAIKPVSATKTATQGTYVAPAVTTPVSITSFETVNENTRKAIVNILCTTDASGPLSPITGSGVFISNDGVILTNAHIAQYFLLKDFNNQKDFVKCVIRTGNPAYPTYTAELIYISTEWIAEHKNDITLDSPKGTGEHDYAFLRVTGRTDGSALPSEFPFVRANITEGTEIGTSAVVASYPAGFLGGQTIIQSLYQSSAVINISDRYTFGENTVDLISLGGSVVAQKGSSGGAVVDAQSTLLGIISTSSDGDTTQSRNLRAITTAYINRSLVASTGISISSLLRASSSYATAFNRDVAPTLTKALSDVIMKK
jgi:hypothetical protein